MSNTIQSLKMHDVKPSNYQINLEKFMERKDKQENSTLRVLSLDDAASVEISQLARAMYEARDAVPKAPATEEENVVDAETDENAASEAVTAKTEDGAAENVTQKTIRIIDLLRDNTSINVTGEAPVDVNSPIFKAESEYAEVFNAATADFADFGGKITMGAYDKNDVSINDINLDAVDKSMWHDSEAVKTILTDSMNAYSSVTEYKVDSAEYSSAKAAADAAAKKISDAYAEQLAYREDKLGFKINGADTEYGENAGKSLSDYIDTTSNGMFVLDFSKIENLSAYYKI